MNHNRKYNILNVSNADKIGFIGDSYTESHFSVEGKAYICKLSLFSDYNYENFAKSGDTYRGNLDRMRKQIPIYHESLSWQDIKPKYAVFISYTNDLKYMDEEQYLNDLRATVETVRGLGAIPIISTEYHTNFGPGLQIGLKQVAQEYNCEVIDLIDEVRATRGEDYEPFWSGTHPGTRSNHLMGDNLERYLDQLPIPRQSLKVFRLRKPFESLDQVIFNTNEERAELFKEINVGHNCLVNEEEVDQVTAAEHAPIVSEYLKLQNQESIEFHDMALVSAILPSSSLGLEEVALNLGEIDAEVYVKDIMKEPYPTPTFYQRFDIEGNENVAEGDTYISDNPHFEGIVFTVKEVTDEAVLMLPYPRIATNIPGKLTKISGQGNEAISYPYTAIGFSNDYPKGKAKIGHYVKLEKIEDRYRIPSELMTKCVDYDKIHFVILKKGDFSLNQIDVEWVGIENKVYTSRPLQKVKAKGKELIAHEWVGNEGSTAAWHSSEIIESVVPEDGCLPGQAIACRLVSDTNQLSQCISYEMSEETRSVQLAVMARYFPEIYHVGDAYSKCQITKESYDYSQVYIDMIYQGKVYTQRRRVGLHWKQIYFDVVLPALTDQVELRIYSKEKPVQVAKVSMKEL